MVATPSGPGTEETCEAQAPLAGRDDLGEATYAMMIEPGEEIHGSGGERLRVLDVVPLEEEDASPFVGMLKVEAA